MRLDRSSAPMRSTNPSSRRSSVEARSEVGVDRPDRRAAGRARTAARRARTPARRPSARAPEHVREARMHRSARIARPWAVTRPVRRGRPARAAAPCACANAPRRRRSSHSSSSGSVNACRGELERERREVGARDLRRRVRQKMRVLMLAARGDSTRRARAAPGAAATLIRRRARDARPSRDVSCRCAARSAARATGRYRSRHARLRS